MKKTEGRQLGFIVSDESRQKARASNPDCRAIYTPHGNFDSVALASKELDLEGSLIKYYCIQGELQRNGYIAPGTGRKPRDYKEWGYIDPTKQVRFKRSVITPLGAFDSVKAAATAHNITSAGIIAKIKSKRPGYEYTE